MADFTIVIPLSLFILSKPSFILVSLKICSVMCLSYSLIPNFYVVCRELTEYMLWFLNKSHAFYWGMHLQNSDSLLVTDVHIMLRMRLEIRNVEQK
jgi:hypothetical protein